MHIIASLILSALLFPFFGFSSLFILIGGFLIDIDHILFYWLRFKSLNIKRAYQYCKALDLKKIKGKKVFMVFHSIELIVIISILSFYHIIFLALSIGMLLHIAMDIFGEYFISRASIKSFSLISHLKNAKK